MRKQLLFGAAFLALLSCTSAPQERLTKSGLDVRNFRTEVDGKQTDLYVLTNKNRMEVCLTNFGGRIVSVMVPDRNGELQDVVLGFDSIGDYITYPTDFGASIGRYANRIKDGRITIDGETIQLPRNNYGHCLHGGMKGWQYKVYEARRIDSSAVAMALHSPDGDENFPGNVTATVIFRLGDDNSIHIRYEAETDKKTIINMTNHSYFNLSGDASRTILGHLLYLNADAFTPVDSTFMTTGEIRPVAGTPMDFTTPKAIAADLNLSDEQVRNGNGYDHNWVLNTEGDMSLVAARLTSPVSGITLEVYTDEPGIQVYSGNFLDGSVKGKRGIAYQQRAAVCLETQHYPDSPNKPGWPSVELLPGQKYTSYCVYKFSVR